MLVLIPRPQRAFAPNGSIRIEYLYVDLGRVLIATKDIDGRPFQVNFRVRDNVIRVALNYLFILP